MHFSDNGENVADVAGQQKGIEKGHKCTEELWWQN